MLLTYEFVHDIRAFIRFVFSAHHVSQKKDTFVSYLCILFHACCPLPLSLSLSLVTMRYRRRFEFQGRREKAPSAPAEPICKAGLLGASFSRVRLTWPKIQVTRRTAAERSLSPLASLHATPRRARSLKLSPGRTRQTANPPRAAFCFCLPVGEVNRPPDR